MRFAIAGAPIEREILRQHMQQHPVALETHLRGELDGVLEVFDIHLAGPAEFVQSTALRALNAGSAYADGDALDRYLGAALSVRHGCPDRFGDGLLIGNAAFVPTRCGRQAVPQIADLIAVEGADNASCAGTARIQTNRELSFRNHFYSTTVIRSSKRRSSVAAPGSRCFISP